VHSYSRPFIYFAGKGWSAEGSHVKIIAHTASTGEAFKETVYN
jgi:hypothetical protein